MGGSLSSMEAISCLHVETPFIPLQGVYEIVSELITIVESIWQFLLVTSAHPPILSCLTERKLWHPRGLLPVKATLLYV